MMPDELLIISSSARMLAQSARRAGITVYALDRFADADTRALCERVFKVPSQKEGFDIPSLLTAIEVLDPDRKLPVLIGSGLDGCAPVIERIAGRRPLMGNGAKLFRLYKNPVRFFKILRQAHLAYPETSFIPPACPDEWLMKFGGSEGGKGVHLPGKSKESGRRYYQRRIASPGYSALFLANGACARIIGFNQLDPLSSAQRPFLFRGARNGILMNGDQRHQIASGLDYLVTKTGLKGLGSLDFVLDANARPLVLEINPRPSATLSLFDEVYDGGLVKAHLEACQGKSLPESQELVESRGFRVIIAEQDLTIPSGFNWPLWSTDHPHAGDTILRGQPLCTVHAGAADGEALEQLLCQRANQLSARLMGANPKNQSTIH